MNIARLPSGELRKMPRVAASQMRRALAEALNVTEVEELVRSVSVHGGLPVAVLSVIESPAGWNIQVRAGTGGVARFTLIGGRPLAMRVAIQEKLEAEL